MTARCTFHDNQFWLFMQTKNQVLSNLVFPSNIFVPPSPFQKTCYIAHPLSNFSTPVHICHHWPNPCWPLHPYFPLLIPTPIHNVHSQLNSHHSRHMESKHHLKKTKHLHWLLNEKNPGPTNHVFEQREDLFFIDHSTDAKSFKY